MCLSANLEILHEYWIKGTRRATTIDPNAVFRDLLSLDAHAVIVAHNHPSGNLLPSLDDHRLTERLVFYSAMTDIELVDHIIVAGRQFYSFAEAGDLQGIRDRQLVDDLEFYLQSNPGDSALREELRKAIKC